MQFKEKQPLYLLAEITDILRGEGGCAWDREQTSQSLKPYLIEEAYELYDAIESGNPDHVREELGDLLYQIYAHARIAMEEKRFTIDDVASGIAEKLVRRHPHVFGSEEAITSGQVMEQWEKIKKEEKAHRESILDGVPRHLPALLKAYRVQQKASRVGFDWEKIEDVVKKIDEEIGEFREAMERKDMAAMTGEAGDLLFSIVNMLRFMKINPEEALQGSVNRFMARFRHIEKRTARMGKSMEDMTLGELDELWEEAKAL